jgi:hypothetical protein
MCVCIVNKLRKSMGLNELDIFLVGVVSTDKVDVGEGSEMELKISSSQLRLLIKEKQKQGQYGHRNISRFGAISARGCK